MYPLRPDEGISEGYSVRVQLLFGGRVLSWTKVQMKYHSEASRTFKEIRTLLRMRKEYEQRVSN